MKCNSCKKELPFTEEYFPKNKSYKNGLEKICKKCRKTKRLARNFPIIYELKCIPSNMYYIGQTIKPIKDRISKHFSDAKRGRKQPLYKDIRKYNYNKKLFEYKELERLSNKELLDEREKFWIKQYINKGLNLYNRELGGKVNCIITNEIKEEMSKSKGIKSFIIYDITSNKVVGEFKSITQAANSLNVSTSTISNYLNNNISHIKNFIAIYKDEFTKENLEIKIDELLSKIKIYENGKIRKIDKYKGKNNAMYGKVYSENPNAKKCCVINNTGKIEKKFETVLELNKYMIDTYNFKSTQEYLVKNKTIKGKRNIQLKGYSFKYI